MVFVLTVLVLLGLPAAAAHGAGGAWSEVLETGSASGAVKILLLLTLLTFVPALVLAMTSFTRLVIVFSMLRHALGTQQAPPNQVMVGLALFLTLFVMQPVWSQVYDQSLAPYLGGEIREQEALEKALGPLRGFMLEQTRKKDLALFIELSQAPAPKDLTEIPTTVLVPSFITSELKTAFEIAFLLYIPFLVIDMVVSSVLMSMGMMLLPPVMIALPFKLMLFVLVDGWNLIVDSLVRSF
ncbi:MAG: flagellar type III secretion system pore protein FliP [bacterium]